MKIHKNVLKCLILFFAGERCTLADYSRLKSMLLDLESQRYFEEESVQQNTMSLKRLLVGNMFKYFDMNEDGFVDHSELGQVGVMLCILSL